MTDFNYGDIIEYIDGTLDENFNAARKWALSHNTTFEELVDRREEREEEETYTEQEEKEVVVPASTKEEVVPVFDEEGNQTGEETTTVEVPEHTEIVYEDVEKTAVKKVLYRYFQIGPEYVPTEDELKSRVRTVRNSYLSSYDFTQLEDAPFTEDEKEKYKEYRQYLRDYTKQGNWWLHNPDDFATWLLAHYPVTEE